MTDPFLLQLFVLTGLVGFTLIFVAFFNDIVSGS